ncbi:unnamed protein product [Rotaria sordida]|uniref:Uncharacterized protein n=2 Tax=Rotaria sordida TaxID=392033 RepID=A0A816CQC3_9BILA|nr:unnamed protein product [Rotaria sordida]CAF1626547.1 unnamed protein product [Rotaria sordida]
MTKNNSTMIQRINTTGARLYSSYPSFIYCLSFLVHGQENLMIQIIQLNQKRVIIGVNNISQNSITETDYIDLKFIFEYTNDSINIIAVKGIEFTISIG